MKRLTKVSLAAMAALALPLAGGAQANSSAEYFRAHAVTPNVPTLLSDPDRQYYRDLFGAIDREDWGRVEAMLAARTDGPLHQVARAEYYLHANSPRVELPAIQAWLANGSTLPQAEQMTQLGLKRGLMSAPYLPAERSFAPQPYASKRILPRGIDDGTMPGEISSAILERIRNDDPDGARVLLDGIDFSLSPQARAEWRQRVAWSYYIENKDAQALAMAETVRAGTGPWVAEGDWVAGLAAWRLGDCERAAEGFDRAARYATNNELTAAAHYWAARALVRCRLPERAPDHLRAAARLDETLYGMLAHERLGQDLPQTYATPDFTNADWQRMRGIENVRIAVQLAEIGRDDLADTVLRHQARIGDPDSYGEMSRLARALGMPGTQLWMAHNAPRGTRSEPALRYPVTRWTPVTGWRVDPALAYAHALQESNFRPAVVSPAGAKGLMQIMPINAREHAPSLGMSAATADLADPRVNLAFGQRNLETLRHSNATDGALPKIMAAYNAGLTPVTRWNTEVRDQGDPLLYMESIPYWETRGYVAIVMRNYWMYERQANSGSDSRNTLAQNRWPGFPALVN